MPQEAPRPFRCSVMRSEQKTWLNDPVPAHPHGVPTASTSPIWIPRACRFVRLFVCRGWTGVRAPTLYPVSPAYLVSGAIRGWGLSHPSRPSFATLRSGSRRGAPSTKRTRKQWLALPWEAFGGWGPCHGPHENGHGCTFLGSPETLLPSMGEVLGWPYGELLRDTVRFRARVASLPRWLAPKITISPPLRTKLPLFCPHLCAQCGTLQAPGTTPPRASP